MGRAQSPTRSDGHSRPCPRIQGSESQRAVCQWLPCAATRVHRAGGETPSRQVVKEMTSNRFVKGPAWSTALAVRLSVAGGVWFARGGTGGGVRGRDRHHHRWWRPPSRGARPSAGRAQDGQRMGRRTRRRWASAARRNKTRPTGFPLLLRLPPRFRPRRGGTGVGPASATPRGPPARFRYNLTPEQAGRLRPLLAVPLTPELGAATAKSSKRFADVITRRPGKPANDSAGLEADAQVDQRARRRRPGRGSRRPRGGEPAGFGGPGGDRTGGVGQGPGRPRRAGSARDGRPRRRPSSGPPKPTPLKIRPPGEQPRAAVRPPSAEGARSLNQRVPHTLTRVR